MYRIEYFCFREGAFWKPLKGFLGLIDQTFPSQDAAVAVCNSLVYRYAHARVIDPWGNIPYEF